MRIAVTGGRTFDDILLLERTLDRIDQQYCFGILLHGNQRGADRMAARWAKENRILVRAFDADWDRQGTAAGPLRNRRMLEDAELLVAFPGRDGTKSCVEIAQSLNIPVEFAR